MRNNQQFEQLMLQYTQLKNGAEDIRKMIENEDFDGAITMIKTREPIFLNCKCMRNYLELTPAEEKSLNQIIEELKELEKNNIETLQARKDEVEEELKKAQKSEKIQQAYQFNENNAGNIVNLEE